MNTKSQQKSGRPAVAETRQITITIPAGVFDDLSAAAEKADVFDGQNNRWKYYRGDSGWFVKCW